MRLTYFFLFMIITIIGCTTDQKVMQLKLMKNNAINKTFSNKEIKDLAKLRLIVDNMVQNYTGETDTKTAYENYIQYLAETTIIGEIKNKIELPYDSLVQAINQNITFQEIWGIDTLNNNSYHLRLNTSGKVIKFIASLSEENSNYSNIMETIEIAGDVSPATIADFIKLPEHYNWNSEAEKLYASIILPILCNKPVRKNQNY